LKQLITTILILAAKGVALGQVLIALIFGDKLQSDRLTFGLNVIPTMSTITNIDGEARSGLGLGLYFDIKLGKNFYLHPEAIPKSSLGSKGIPPYSTGNDSLDVLFTDGSIKRHIRAISLPMLCRYRIKGLLFAEAGPQINWTLKVKDIYETGGNDNELTYTTRVDEHFTRFDFGIASGLNYKLKKDKGMALGVRYFYGLTDMMKAEGYQANQALHFIISIPVGAEADNTSRKDH
jgi:hypothetical protein